jgi:hypothetical protein
MEQVVLLLMGQSLVTDPVGREIESLLKDLLNEKNRTTEVLVVVLHGSFAPASVSKTRAAEDTDATDSSSSSMLTSAALADAGGEEYLRKWRGLRHRVWTSLLAALRADGGARIVDLDLEPQWTNRDLDATATHWVRALGAELCAKQRRPVFVCASTDPRGLAPSVAGPPAEMVESCLSLARRGRCRSRLEELLALVDRDDRGRVHLLPTCLDEEELVELYEQCILLDATGLGLRSMALDLFGLGR